MYWSYFTYICPCVESNGYFHGTHSIDSEKGGSCESSPLNMFCLYFTYICPAADSNGFFYGSHTIDSDEVAHASILILICTGHILLTSVLVLSLMVISTVPTV